MEDVVLNRVGILGLFCPNKGQGLRPSAAPLQPNIGQQPPPPPRGVVSFPKILVDLNSHLKATIFSLKRNYCPIFQKIDGDTWQLNSYS